ncbi:uncharacterized protein LOC126657171 [Mercurialis annua]|uniref:uncharacterized protein LOC126657171 n=1 Tax=Mercurialis annua TaxID=3986 RepID=UPI00215FF777|nr:uncharacterized protein LOC126657171 [Mercurialis annua]
MGEADDDLNAMYAQLRLTDGEQSVVSLEDVVDDEINDTADLSLIGKLLTKKPYNLSHMKNALASAWRLARGFEMRDIGDNLFVCEFYSKLDRNRIVDEAPWHFDKQLILFEPLNGNMQPNNMMLVSCPVWVRIYDLPLNCRGKGAISKIGAKFGQVIDWKAEEGSRWGRYGRVKVILDISKPLVRGTKIANSLGELSWVYFKYERIQNYCYWCGMLDHMMVDCEVKPENTEVSEWSYGPNLRATPRKRLLMGGRGSTSQKSQESHLNFQEEQVAEGNQLGEDFVEINVAQVSSLQPKQFGGVPEALINTSQFVGKNTKKGTWTRSKVQKTGAASTSNSVERTGKMKRGYETVQSSTDPLDFFSKKSRDELVGQLESVEISAETDNQSRRKP